MAIHGYKKEVSCSIAAYTTINNKGWIETSLVLIDWLIDWLLIDREILKFPWRLSLCKPGKRSFVSQGGCFILHETHLTGIHHDQYRGLTDCQCIIYLTFTSFVQEKQYKITRFWFRDDISKRSVKFKKKLESHGPHSSHEQDFKLHLQLVLSINAPFSNSGVRVFEKKYAKKILISYPTSWLACMYM